MKLLFRLSVGFTTCLLCIASASAGTFEYKEDFKNGANDWVTYMTSGGRAGGDGKYIRVTRNIVTTPADPNGSGLIEFRCEVAPSQAPTLNCSKGIFAGNYINMPTLQLRYWFRHSSTRVGGLQPYVRIPTPANTPGASAVYLAAIPANTWTEIVVNITAGSFDPTFGGSDYNTIFSNVGRLQPGIFFPVGVTYSESNVNLDIDDVRITGTALDAVANVEGVLTKTGAIHPHHDGTVSSPSQINDLIPVTVYGASTSVGDPVNLNANNVVASSVRFARNFAPVAAGQAPQFVDDDADGLTDVRLKFRTGSTGLTCTDTSTTVDGRLSTGQVFVDSDTFTKDCNAGCH
jgi:hypothetical protein